MLYGRHRRREARRDLSGCSLGEDIIGLGCQFSASGLHLLGNHALAGGGGDTPKELEPPLPPTTQLRLDWKE